MDRIGLVTRIVGWAIVTAALALAFHNALDASEHLASDWASAIVLAINGTLTLAGLWYLIARHSPWCAYWLPRAVSELGHWLFDLFWTYVLAFMSMLFLPFLGVLLAFVPPVLATVLLVRRFRSEPGPSAGRLPFWI